MCVLNLSCGSGCYGFGHSLDRVVVEFQDWRTPLGVARRLLRRFFVGDDLALAALASEAAAQEMSESDLRAMETALAHDRSSPTATALEGKDPPHSSPGSVPCATERKFAGSEGCVRDGGVFAAAATSRPSLRLPCNGPNSGNSDLWSDDPDSESAAASSSPVEGGNGPEHTRSPSIRGMAATSSCPQSSGAALGMLHQRIEASRHASPTRRGNGLRSGRSRSRSRSYGRLRHGAGKEKETLLSTPPKGWRMQRRLAPLVRRR